MISFIEFCLNFTLLNKTNNSSVKIEITFIITIPFIKSRLLLKKMLKNFGIIKIYYFINLLFTNIVYMK